MMYSVFGPRFQRGPMSGPRASASVKANQTFQSHRIPSTTKPFLRSWKMGVLALLLSVAAVPDRAVAAVFYPETFTLANGLQFVVVRNNLSPAVAQMVWYKVGAVDEVKGKSGLAHYLEHLMFRGTEQIAPGDFSDIVAAEGGNDNAFTSHDYTGYHEVVSADRLAMVMQLEADRMQHLQITPEAAMPELSVVLNERDERTDNTPQGKFQEQVAATLFPHHPYGRPVIGIKSEIAKASVSDAIGFYQAHYAPNNAVVVISGNVELADVMRLAAGTFGRLPSHAVAKPAVLGMPSVPTQKSLVMQDARVEQPTTESMWVVPSALKAARQSHALEVLQEVLDGGEIGLLYRSLVVDEQIATAIGTDYDPAMRGPSIFSIQMVPRPGINTAFLEKRLQRLLKKTAQKGIDAFKIAEAKKRLTRSAIFARDSLMAPCHVFGQALVVGQKISDIENWPQNIASVSVAEVNQALRDLMANKRHMSASLLPDPNAEKVPHQAKAETQSHHEMGVR